MNFRPAEYLEHRLSAPWLDTVHAKHAYDDALQFSAKTHFGLNRTTVQIVHSRDEVCVLPGNEVLAKWQNIFAPARDDSVVQHMRSSLVLLYCHEEELEYDHRWASPDIRADSKRLHRQQRHSTQRLPCPAAARGKS